MFMGFLDLAELLERFLILLLLLAISIDHIDRVVKVVLNLAHLSGYHLLHFLIIFYHALRCPVLYLSHNFIENFSLKLLSCIRLPHPASPSIASITSRQSSIPLPHNKNF